MDEWEMLAVELPGIYLRMLLNEVRVQACRVTAFKVTVFASSPERVAIQWVSEKGSYIRINLR